MALDLLRVAEAFTTRGGRRIVARLGVNSGEALAGVVGYNKPQFCLFGDTINTAARMQSTGERHKLQISSSTYALLAADAQAAAPFVFEQREVMAKGKGLMVTYLVSYKPHIDPAKQR
ncbi:nucleotide cyclase, partial [Pavlovales sp. CCMP2436]